ncbi:hypothetical protein CEP52_014225 [Fusarium oligoseptatum]|uniref:Uncharacterized protein n=1 Tax=Fusarium oligoseptatum TaxID=2604345 RepID=A0A428SNX7_9HYPO|nr:hypothetical protein CEP52_014225 [Fusarium oligoseptatum]
MSISQQQAMDEAAQRVIDERGPLKEVEADIVCLDGHRFRINYGVPQHVTDKLDALFWQDEEVKYEDIPEELKAYEVMDEQPDEEVKCEDIPEELKVYEVKDKQPDGEDGRKK